MEYQKLFSNLFRFSSQTNSSDKNTSEDDAVTAKNSIANHDTTTKPQVIPTHTPSDISSQSNEVAQPAPSTSPTVSQQHQASLYQQPFLPVMYTQLPNMTSHPRMPQGISVESDGSDLPEGAFVHVPSPTRIRVRPTNKCCCVLISWIFPKQFVELPRKLDNPEIRYKLLQNRPISIY